MSSSRQTLRGAHRDENPARVCPLYSESGQTDGGLAKSALCQLQTKGPTSVSRRLIDLTPFESRDA